jgi:hypothetical protein
MVIMLFLGSVKGGRKCYADINCLRQSDIETIFSGCKNSPRKRVELKWKKAIKFTRQNTIAIAAVFMNISNAWKQKMGHPSARLASETVSMRVRHNLQQYP